MVNKGVYLYSLRQLLKQETAYHAERKQGESFHQPRFTRRVAVYLQLSQPVEHAESHQNRNSHQRYVPGQRVDGIAVHRLHPGRGLSVAAINAELLQAVAVGKTADILHIATPCSPVHQNDAQHYRQQHAGGGHGVAQCNPIFPAIGGKALCHAADGTVPALEADFQ